MSTARITASGFSQAATTQDGSFSSFADARASSLFQVGFDLDRRHNFTLSGSVFNAGQGVDATSVVSLTGGNDFDTTFSIRFNTPSNGEGEIPFSISEVLLPASYTLRGSGEASGFFSNEGGVARYDLLFSVTPVPLPAAVWLFGSALVFTGMIVRRRRTIGT
ncbi:MAG: hypothetical protein ACR2RL_24990 [Gammaproteobacteria bacterium]